MFHDVAQNTDEWFKLRAGRLTASNFGTVMANLGKAFGEPAKKYAVRIALEQLVGPLEGDSYQNEHMARGHEQEPIARMLYEEEYFCDVLNGGFFEEDWIGVSPDGLVGENGLIEIKSVLPHVHHSNVKRQSFDPAYRWQILGQLKYTGREWLDFVSFCANYPDDKKLYVCRLYAENFNAEFSQMDDRIADFKDLVITAKDSLLSNDYFVELN